LAFFYFDFNDDERSKVESLIRSIIAQLFARNVENSTALDKLFSQYQDGAFQPPLADLLTVLSEMITGFGTTYVVVDALDECAELEELLKILYEIQGWAIDHLHLIVTSRYLPDIDRSISGLATDTLYIQESAVQEDISLYITERLKIDHKLSRWPPEVQQLIWKTLNRDAGAM